MTCRHDPRPFYVLTPLFQSNRALTDSSIPTRISFAPSLDCPHLRAVNPGSHSQTKMYKRSLFTSITPLPKDVARKAAVAWLHDHAQMIRLNPLVLRLHETTPAANASADEFDCAWYEITDEISYLPGGLYKGEVTYKACFNDLPNGVQTHTFAPAGLDLRGKWTVGGNEPGEPREKLELGSDAPRDGLYIKEDVDMRCNILLTGFVKKNLTKSHKSVVDKLASLGTSPDEHAPDGGYVHSQSKPQHQPLTPVDSNTVFGPDSYTVGHSAGSQKEPSSEPFSHHVGNHKSRRHQTQSSRLHPHSHNPSFEVLSEKAPQLPPLDFSEPSDNENFRSPKMESETSRHQELYSSKFGQAAKYTGQFHGEERSVLPGLGTGADLHAHRPLAATSHGGNVPYAVRAQGLAEPKLHNPQRLSTDYTWRPGLRPGEFI